MNELFNAVVLAILDKCPKPGARVHVSLACESSEHRVAFGAAANAVLGITQYNFGFVVRDSAENALRALAESVAQTPEIMTQAGTYEAPQ